MHSVFLLLSNQALKAASLKVYISLNFVFYFSHKRKEERKTANENVRRIKDLPNII